MTATETPNRPAPAAAESPFTKVPEAELDDILGVIETELQGCHRLGDVTVYGHKYTLRTLDPADRSWVMQFVDGTNGDAVKMADDFIAPACACALTHIDDKPVSALFRLPELGPKPTADELEYYKLLESEPLLLDNWRRRQVLKWLLRPGKHPQLLDQLYVKYGELNKEREVALGQLGPLSVAGGVPTGTS